jgi:hypothetical protein
MSIASSPVFRPGRPSARLIGWAAVAWLVVLLPLLLAVVVMDGGTQTSADPPAMGPIRWLAATAWA